MIIYAAVARVRDGTILVEVTSATDFRGNVGQVMATFLAQLKDRPELIGDGERKTFIQRNEVETDFFSHFIEACAVNFNMGDDGEAGGVDEHYFHIFRKDEVFYSCLGDDPDPRDQKVNFAFLEHLQKEFVRMYKPWRINNANAYAFNRNFSPSLRSAIHYHNINHKQLSRDAKVQGLLTQVEDFKKLMGRNMNVLMENQKSISSLMIMSESMEQDAQVFKKRSTQLQRKKSRKFFCVSLCSFVVVLILIYITVLSICGPRFEYCRGPNMYDNRNNNNSNNGDGGDGNDNANNNGGGD